MTQSEFLPKRQKSRLFIRPREGGKDHVIIQSDAGKASVKCLLPSITKNNEKLDTGNAREFFNLTK